ncbi:MAG: 5'-3' exonuclease H3TH domain-containing protein, partial [Patescibacteria group bacterium]
MTSKQPKLIIIDGNALIHRAFHALPPLTSKSGQLVNAVYGFALILLKIYKDLKPEYLVLTLDRAKKTFRHEAYADYKATRVKQPDELYAQIPLVKDLAAAFNIPLYELDGYEADDLIGTIAHQTAGKVKNVIVTGDLDALQLVNDDTEVFTLKKGITDTITYDAAAVKERYGLEPGQMIDYKGLRGDASDNIPGVKGIGEKTAVELLQKFGSLENIYKEIKKQRNKEIAGVKPRIQKLLIEQEKEAFMSKQLGTIMTDAPIEFDLGATKVTGFDSQAVFKLFQELGFKSLLSRLPEQSASGAIKAEKKQGDLFGGQSPESRVQSPESRIQSGEFKIREGYHLINDEKS